MYIYTYTEALEFAKQHMTKKSKEREAKFYARKSLLYKEDPWIKKQSNNFDVTMGSYGGVEICELTLFSCYF